MITLSRLFITIYIFFKFEPEVFSSFNLILLIAVIGISDSIDGIIARKYNLVSKLGIILDPVYTSKGFAALIDYVKKGIIKKGENVIFMFTGGSPAVFAYNEELSKNNS